MKIGINTKFNIGDKVIGYTNGRLYRFEIEDIECVYNTTSSNPNIRYSCVAMMPPESKDTFSANFLEHEIHTMSEIKDMIQILEQNNDGADG